MPVATRTRAERRRLARSGGGPTACGRASYIAIDANERPWVCCADCGGVRLDKDCNPLDADKMMRLATLTGQRPDVRRVA